MQCGRTAPERNSCLRMPCASNRYTVPAWSPTANKCACWDWGASMGSMADTGSSVRTAACKHRVGCTCARASNICFPQPSYGGWGQDHIDSSMLACVVANRRADQALPHIHSPGGMLLLLTGKVTIRVRSIILPCMVLDHGGRKHTWSWKPSVHLSRPCATRRWRLCWKGLNAVERTAIRWLRLLLS